MGVMRKKWGRRREGDKGDLVHHLPSYVIVSLILGYSEHTALQMFTDKKV